MAGENQLLKFDTIVADGVAIAFEDGSGSLEGAARWENNVVPSASGDDFTSRKRVPTMLRAKIQFGNTQDPAAWAAMQDIQITARDTLSGRRCLLTRCTFGSMGAVGGGGSVDMMFGVLSTPQWL